MKKLNKFFAVLVALAMMATLCVSMAFADPPAADADVSNNADYNSAEATLVKYLKIPQGYTLPDETFVFNFEPTDDSEDGATASPISIAVSEMTESGNTADGGSLVCAKPLADAFAFTKPGFYEFTVSEEPTNDLENMDYDDAEYTVRLYVSRSTIEGESYTIDNITIVNSEDEKEKTEVNDPTIVNGENQNIDQGDVGNGLVFTNVYTPEERADNALEVSKSISGQYADDTFPFPFEITVTNEDFTGDATIPVTKGDGTSDTLELGVAYRFTLVAGQTLVIPNLPEGTTYTVTEKLHNSGVDRETSYQASASTAGIDADVEEDVDKGDDLTVASADGEVISDDDAVANEVNYLNTADDLTPTGILISNLPYIALALVAIGGLVAYVVVRRRQDDEA